MLWFITGRTQLSLSQMVAKQHWYFKWPIYPTMPPPGIFNINPAYGILVHWPPRVQALGAAGSTCRARSD